jgi:hypothetical protein
MREYSILIALLAYLSPLPVIAAPIQAAPVRVEVTLDKAARREPVTGRIFFLISRIEGREPRLTMPYTFAYYFNAPSLPYAPLWGRDVESMAPGDTAVIDDTASGYPFHSIRDIPAGDFNVQAVLHVYERFPRADGHVIWAPMDDWEGQQFHLSPGNLVSEPVKLHLDPQKGFVIKLALTRTIPPIESPPDTKWIRRIKIKSDMLTKFWGHDIYLGATVLLPKGYDEHPQQHYPVLYYQGHFLEAQPLGFLDDPQAPLPANASRYERSRHESGSRLFDAWTTPDMPRMIVVTLEHPTPFYDDSYAVNSAYLGPWGDAIMQELIPAVETRFRIIRAGYARVLTGASTGGWTAAALQIQHPRFFGGAWIFCPDPVDFRYLLTVNIYDDDNAFIPPGYEWFVSERAMARTVDDQVTVTMRQLSQLSVVLGSHGRGGEFLDNWSAMYGPVGADGYPRPIWNHQTGAIDHEVAQYWRDNGYDLRYYLEHNWSKVGPDLVGKLRFSCGDMDNFYTNLAMYEMENFLKSTTNPAYGGEFIWGRPKVGHGYYGFDPWPMKLLETMAAHITKNAPASEDSSGWHYP